MQQNRRKQLENYFYHLRLKNPLIIFAISFFTFLIMIGSQFNGIRQLSLIVSLGSLAVICYQLYRYFSVPDDESVDAWLADDIDRLVRQSYDKVGIAPSEKMPDPLVIISPVYWSTRGVDFKDLGMRKGKDKMLRFSVYHITIFHLDEYILASYRCDYNFLRGTSLNEATNEYHYKDVVSVATVEASSNFHLPDGQKFVHFQEFRLSVSSGESIRVTLNPQLLTDAHRAKLPPSGADRAVSVIRNMLRAKKV
ncbi:hypothetical protein EGT74_19280 [Chitinophaga lutea]|uniref:Uncharacterized protein n=1 Tax=Chitinophaga lutea TaxID=2488634 RepID=A0A3N4QBM1_9BACT|nr:hypothetical protein [Chitinophaga lutea]RPE09154.1 hypothetical protein EGT74_19280 [Chitinophaga lutea]